MFVLINILPFLLPIIFILLFFWYLSRQVKGAGMQAMTFGQSRRALPTRMIKTTELLLKTLLDAKKRKKS